MIITKTEIPLRSFLRTDSMTYDYSDSFQGEFIDSYQRIGITEVGKSFFSSGPKWIEVLFAFRNSIVGLFGLKTLDKITDRQKMLEDSKFEKGAQIGFFKVYDKTTDEIILGEDDKHLDFRVSLFVDKQDDLRPNKKLIISTTVKYNNWLGKLYFFPVKPFHKLIVPTMLKRMIKDIEQRN